MEGVSAASPSDAEPPLIGCCIADMRLSRIVVGEENTGQTDRFRGSYMADVWIPRVKNLLKAELKRRGVSCRELAEKLTAMGVPESERTSPARSRGAALPQPSSSSAWSPSG